MTIEIRVDDLRDPRIAAFLEEHLSDMRSVSPPESKHALDLEGLKAPEITFWSVWEGEELVGCGALKRLDARHAELKSMRTSPARRRQGLGARVLRHALEEGRRRGFRRVSLETGSMAFFEPARALYRAHGFAECAPFGDYRLDPNSVFMTRELPFLGVSAAALLVIDIQRGAFDGVRCPPIARGEELVANALALVRAARAAAVPVVFVQHFDGAGEVFEEGSAQALLHEALAPLPHEPVVSKRRSNGFEDTELTAVLARLGRTELVACGLQSERCVFNTAAGALQRGFSVLVADDAHTTWKSESESAEEISREASARLLQLGASAASTLEIAAEMTTSR